MNTNNKKFNSENPAFVFPNWPVDKVIALTTTKRIPDINIFDNSFFSGVGFNLALHVNDDAHRVQKNRERLQQVLNLFEQPYWLKQVHGANAVEAYKSGIHPEADASFSREKGKPCAVLTADCLPLLLCNRQGNWVSAVHAGWRGLEMGVVQSAVAQYSGNPKELMAWLGPAIGAQCYEIGTEVYEAFMAKDTSFQQAFQKSRENHWTMDIYAIANHILQSSGISEIYGGDHCTYLDSSRFYSYRRDGETGRMASLIWIAA